jgi:hypothetical protein
LQRSGPLTAPTRTSSPSLVMGTRKGEAFAKESKPIITVSMAAMLIDYHHFACASPLHTSINSRTIRTMPLASIKSLITANKSFMTGYK